MDRTVVSATAPLPSNSAGVFSSEAARQVLPAPPVTNSQNPSDLVGIADGASSTLQKPPVAPFPVRLSDGALDAVNHTPRLNRSVSNRSGSARSSPITSMARAESLVGNKSKLRMYLHTVDDENLPMVDLHTYFYGIAFAAIVVYVVALLISHYVWEEDELAHSYMIAAFEEADPFKGEYNLSPTSKLNALQFVRYGTVFLWITCCISGLGGEVVFGQFVVSHISDESGKALYHLSQLFFSLSLAVALFSGSPFGLPFLVLGLWKVGFPETIGCFLKARRLGIFASRAHAFGAMKHFLNGMGTLLHHTAAAYVVCACVTHLCPVNRITLATCMPIVMQHWFVLVRYHSFYLYGFIEASLEVLFEWEVFANLPDINNKSGYDMTIRAGALTMLCAHWCYWSAALLGLIEGETHERRDKISFQNMDKDGSGAIDKHELGKALEHLGHACSEEEVDLIFAELDVDGDGTVTLKEFEEVLAGGLGDELADHDIIEWRKTAQDFRKAAQQRHLRRLQKATHHSAAKPHHDHSNAHAHVQADVGFSPANSTSEGARIV